MSSPSHSIPILLWRLWAHASHRRRRQFGLLLILMVLTSFAEIVSIGAVLPFLGVLTAPEKVFLNSYARPLVEKLELSTPDQLLLVLTISFGLAAIVAGVMRLLLLWANTRLSFAMGADLSIDIYRRTLYQPYSVHIERNSSEIINGIIGKSNNVIYSIVLPVLTLISSGIMLLAILGALLSVQPVVALAAFGGFGAIYAFIIKLTRNRLVTDGRLIARESTQVLKSLQEGLGGIRDVLIDGSQDTHCQIYREADRPLRRAQGNNLFISQSPRYGMEALGMVLIAILAYVLSRQAEGFGRAIPILGALALGAQRLLPVLQQAYGAWSSIQAGQSSLEDSLDLLDQPLPGYVDKPSLEPFLFQHQISLNSLSFRYSPQAPWIFKDLNLTLLRGGRIGFVGTTGSGKSTLLDIVMGLLQPTQGTLAIDGEVVTLSNQRAWQANIAHVPQTIYLADSSVEENIAFGVPKNQIDPVRVRKAAQQAQVADVIEALPMKYQTFVGERGIRLSGGQRQRIGIARALYKQANVLIFDEATSALDIQTEEAVMECIEDLGEGLTIVLIAHRLSTLKNCTQIVEMGANGVVRVGTYREIMASPPFRTLEAQAGKSLNLPLSSEEESQ